MATSHSTTPRRLSRLLRALRPSTWPFITVGALLLYRIWEGLSGFAASYFGGERTGWLIILLQALDFLKHWLLITLSGFLVIAVHEAGHLVARWMVGFRFHAVR